MKTLFFSFLFSTSLFACPVLTGVYENCTSDSHMSGMDYKKLTISQVTKAKVTTYTLISVGEDDKPMTVVFKADGKPMPTHDSKITATCNGTGLIINQLSGSNKASQVLRLDGKDLKMTLNLNGASTGTSKCKRTK